MNAKIANLRNLLKKHNLDGVFVSSLPNIAYLTNYAGFSVQDRDAFLLITKDSQYIFTHGIYKEDVKNKIKDFTLIEMKRENPISTAVKNAIQEHKIKKLGFEAFDLKVSEFRRLTSNIDPDILVATDLINKLRIIKSHDEIAALKKACELGDNCFSHILKKVTVGITESQLAAELEYFIKSNGADVSFPTIIAFEENAAHPHHMPTNKKLENNSFVLFDFGVLLNNYCSDMTRTIIFGNASEEKRRIFETVREAQQEAIAFIEKKLVKHEPVPATDVDTIAREYIISKGFPQMPHSLGHGIGLEVHEAPRLTPVTNETLENGMVFSIEPGIYLPGNTGVRIEDLFAIENNKLIQLTQSKSTL